MKKELVLAFVIAASYLVLSLPLTSATAVSVVVSGGSQLFPLDENKVSRTITVDTSFPTLPKVQLTVTNASVVEIEKMLVYKCKNLVPTDCAQTVQPDQFSGNINKVYEWAELADTGSFPQTARLLILVKLANPGASWIPLWEKIQRTDATVFDTTANSGVDQITASGNSNVQNVLAKTRSFVQLNQMFPYSWLEQLSFSGATLLYVITSSMAATPPVFEKQTVTADSLADSIPSTYGFVFPVVGSDIRSPVAVAKTGGFVAGDNSCDTDSGESQANSCYDCGCFSGSYCDAAKGCTLDSQLTASLVTTPVTSFGDCRIPHTFNVSVRANNPPAGLTLLKANYSINSTSGLTACTGSPTGYLCPVTAPPVPGCSPGTYTQTRNNITLTFSYPDGPRQARQKVLTVPLPDVSIGSWTCGDGQAETTIGESPANCCYDVTCPDLQYCDISSAAPDKSVGACNPQLSNNSLSISSNQPSSFVVHTAANTVQFTFTLSSKPSGFQVVSRDLKFSCSDNTNAPCTAPSTFSCSPVAAASPYAETCSATFSITNYDNLKGYTIIPELRLQTSYTNGPGTTTTYLARTGSQIGVGANYCGDNICQPNENAGNCCFDCSCSATQYCDSRSTQAPAAGDSCREVAGLSYQLSSLLPAAPAFTDLLLPHNIEVNGTITNVPSGIITADNTIQRLSASCELNGSFDLSCQLSCKFRPESGNIFTSCDLTVPAFDYASSPYYSSLTRQVSIQNNSIHFTLTFNNGSSAITQQLNYQFPTITVGATFHRNDFQCETALGESAANSCVECPCQDDPSLGPDYFCFPGIPAGPAAGEDKISGSEQSLNKCIKLDKLTAALTKVTPEKPKCMQKWLGDWEDKCEFPEAVSFDVKVNNPPAGLAITGATYTMFEKTNDAACAAVPINQRSTFKCYIDIDEVTTGTNWTTVTDGGKTYARAPITLNLPLTFSSAAAEPIPVIQNATLKTELKLEFAKSDEVLSCQTQKARIDKSISSQKTMKTIVTAILAAFTAIVLGICATAIHICTISFLSFSPGMCAIWTKACVIGGIVLTCVASGLLPLLGSVEQKQSELQANSDNACASVTIGGTHAANKKMTGMWYTVGGSVAGVACLVGSLGLGFGWFGITSKAAAVAAPVAGGLTQGVTEIGSEINQFPSSVEMGDPAQRFR